MKSTSHYAFSLGSRVFSRLSKKQQTIVQSSTKAIHISASLATSQVIWLRKILEDIGEKLGEAKPIFFDNKSAITMSKNPVFHSRKKHITIKYHFIRDAIEDRKVDSTIRLWRKLLISSHRHFQQLRETLKEFKKNALSERMLICNL